MVTHAKSLVRALSTAAVLTAGLGIGSASAAPTMAPAKPVVDGAVMDVSYYYRGREYCWYYDGWHGPGWYWCGYAWRRGYGWGSPVWGWNNWAWSGPRYRVGPGPRFYGRTPGGHYYGRSGGHGGGHRGRH